MNKRLFTLISISFSLAIIVLVWFQVYWIRKDFKVREEFFKSKVDEALNNTSTKLAVSIHVLITLRSPNVFKGSIAPILKERKVWGLV